MASRGGARRRRGLRAIGKLGGLASLCVRFCARLGARLAVMAEGATGPGAAALRAVENCGEEIERIEWVLLSASRRSAAPGPDGAD